MHRSGLKPASFVVMFALLLVACGGSANEPEAGSQPSESTQRTTDTATTNVEAATNSAEPTTADAGATDAALVEKTTIEDFLGVATSFVRGGGLLDGGIDPARLAQEQQLIEIEVQRCMQQLGFEYTPEQVNEGIQLFGGAESSGLSEAEYAATQGFGITTRFDAVFEGDIDLTNDEPTENELVLESLSQGEADAWRFALGGATIERNAQGQAIDPDTGEAVQGGGFGATGGCELQATTSVRGDFSVLSELGDEFAELDERIEADPRITEINADWAVCMRDLGFAYQNVDEARDDFEQQLRPLLVAFFIGSGLTPQGGGGLAGQAANLQALADFGLNDAQEAELVALQELEIIAAVAALECAGDTQIEIDEITAGYESEFVETNRSVLEQISG